MNKGKIKEIHEELISIIIPVYNVNQYLVKCLESIVNQTYTNLQIVLVDDGSTDSSGRICDDYAKQDSRIKVIHKINGGLSDARNTGINIANGDYITFVDSDDYVCNEYIETLFNLLKDYDADVAIGSFQYVNSNQYSNNQEENNESNTAYLWNAETTLRNMLLQQKITTSACVVLSKRTLWTDVRFPAGKLFEDMGTSYKIYAKAKRVVYTDKVLYFYFIREGSIQNMIFNQDKMDELEMGLECKNFIENSFPKLREAAINRLVSICFHILFSIDICSEYIDEQIYLKKVIILFRKKMIFGNDVNKKVRLGCALTYFGFNFTKFIYQRFGMRGKINL